MSRQVDNECQVQLPDSSRNLNGNEQQKSKHYLCTKYAIMCIVAINVGYSMRQDFVDLRGKLGDLVYDIKKKFEEAHIDINDLKDYISLYDPDEKCSYQLREARDMSEVFFIVRTQLCSLLNCSILQKLAQKFNLQDSEKIIQDYEIAKENYRRLLISSSFADELRKESQFLSKIEIDLPGSEHTKEYYMETIKQLFINCKQEGGMSKVSLK